MADIALTAANISPVYPEKAEIYDMVAVEAVTKGQPVYQTTAGKVGVADANAAGKQQVRGIALKKVAAGGTVPVLKKGHVYGYTVSGLNGDAVAYLSDTAGSLADTAGSMTVPVGRVATLPDLTKVLFVDASWQTIWS